LSGQRSRTTLGPPLGALLGAEAPTNFKFPQNRHFVGRDQELAELHDLLDDAVPLGVNAARTTSTVAGLTGLGGVGKTQLVVEYIHRYGKSYPGGIFWINAADGVEDDFVEIGRIISGDGYDKKPDELIRISFDYLRSDPDTLLVVDNLNEPALLNQPVADTLTPISLPCRLLFTTRRRDLRGLRSIAVDMLTEADALKLLLRSRPAILENSHSEHPVAVKLCATLGGLPLAIEMAAAYLEQEEDVTLSGYLKRLGKEGSLQTLDTLDQAKEWSPTWHDPIQITLQSQWDTLTHAEARLLLQAAALMPEAAAIPLARLSLLTGLSPIAEEGYPAPLASALRRLHNYSLIEKLDDEQVRLHPLVREFVRTQIADITGFSSQCASNMATALEDMLRANKEIIERGVDELLKDMKLGLMLHPENAALEELRLVVDREAHNLRKDFSKEFQGYTLQQIRQRAFDLNHEVLLKRTENALDQLQVPWFRELFRQNWESRALLRSFEGHKAWVEGVAITPDGRQAISASGDGTLRLWDLESGESLLIFEGHTDGVTGAAISPDGKHAVSASADKTLRLWDLQSGECLRSFKGHTDRVETVAISKDGRYVISGSADKTLRVWDLKCGECLHTFEGHTNTVTGVAITPDGSQAVSVSWDGTLRTWDLQSNLSLSVIETHIWGVTGIAFSPDGRCAMLASMKKTLALWDLQSGACLRIFEGHTDMVNAVVISQNGMHAVSASNDNTLRLWDLKSGESLRIFEGHKDLILDVAISPDGEHAVSACKDKTLRLWDLQGGNDTPMLEGHTKQVTAVAISPDGKHAISASQDITLRLWDLQSGKSLRTFEGYAELVHSVAISPDGRHAISTSGSSLRMWDLQGGKSLYTIEGRSDTVTGMAISSDGRYYMSAFFDDSLHLWDLQSNESLCTFKGNIDSVDGVAISPDGRHIVSVSGRNLQLWDPQSGEMLRSFEGHTKPVTAVAISPDGRHILSASMDKTLRLWDLQNGECLQTFEAHTDTVTGVVISPDGKQAVSASLDKTLRLWDLQSGRVQLVFASASFSCLSIDTTGALMVVGASSGYLHFVNIVDNRKQLP
jgi:WD40 repeat protein